MSDQRTSFVRSKDNVVPIRMSSTSSKTPPSLLDNPQIYRQSRVENVGQLQLRVGEQSFQLLNWSRTGIGFEMTKETAAFPVGLKIGPARVFVGEIKVYDGDIEIRSVRKLNENSYAVGAEFKGDLFLVEGIESAERARRCLEDVLAHDEAMENVSAEVCKLIVAMGSSLHLLKDACDEQESRLRDLTFDEREECLRVFLPSVVEGAGKIIRGYNQKLAKLVDVESLPEDSIYHRLFEEHIYPLFQGAEFGRRAVEKPRGYAGDYEMMNQIYRHGYEGDSLFAKVLHGYMVNEDTGESVRFRRPYFIGHMESLLDVPGPKSFLSIACGPAIEVQEVISRWPQEKLDRVNFHLLDIDRKALDHAQTKIMERAMSEGKNPNIEFINLSVKNLLTRAKLKENSLDLVYSGGLFDYLDQMTSKMLVQILFRVVKPGGRLVVGNFLKNSTAKGFLHVLFQWHLIHRTEEEMRDWATGLENCSIRFDLDTKRINGFIVLEKQ